ncbi:MULTISPECIES: aspartate aminotransferase family protein [unclassified Mycolicibacterium]|uniref:aspartate aminotransferase family protein n=1 Tax=unclassified Mycolicibacterium TaxID=2636767 RepID=UPI00130CDA24|nr:MULTISPECIES: aspartate aminotransferase family protein [unclassified Mycolicibacterium]MUL81910.1 aspartate aminotransferase family protein [Mycolicibacterium sp. CBMA 329]MUL87676.1 aspartate aminotransferase family protein [Mycolicibacterium sp. CBMA 331]MUL99461.1 aspartate aminotransferase family protein [Mycolicibacterium sp. CBMA 334]MUM27401.1 aspartate aminotransferase family protein [Mycolicibacterium sp. CBMA 295]MUM37973.1 aspartate aminotransferase family protein [Mycolicibacte
MRFSNIMDSNSYTGDLSSDPDTERLIETRTRLLGPAYRLFYERPVHLVRGSGSHLFDADGARYLDAYNNVVSVGHCHPHVVAAITRQAETLNTHTRYLHDGIVKYSQRLLDTLGLDQVMYACTGSEANDLALRVAQMYTGARGVIVTRDAYHGNTEAVTAISPSIGGATTIGSHVRAVAAPDSYRSGADVAARFLADVETAITDLRAAGHGLSCLIVDTFFSSDGIYPDPSVLAPAVAAVRAAGGVFIADEVQPGFGRTGEAMWGFTRHGVVPDLVTMGKPMANGLPVAAMAARSEVLDAFAREVPYFNTFGGNPVSMAAAAAVLDVIEDEQLMVNAARVGTALRDELTRLAADHPRIGDVRGAGLYAGVEMVSADDPKTPDRAGAHDLVNAMRDRKVLISVCGADGNVLKVRPPLVFSMSDVDWFCTEFAGAVAALH